VVHQAEPENGDWRRFAISKQMCVAVQEHIEEYRLGPEDLLFPQWMFAYVRSSPVLVTDNEDLPPLVSKSGAVYEHGTTGARYSMNCHCAKCKAYAADYQRQWRRQRSAQRPGEDGLSKADTGRRDGTEFLMAEVWLRFWNAARDAAGMPEGFTPYNAATRGSTGPSIREWTCRRSASARGTAASRSHPGMPRSSMSATPASQMLSRKSLTIRALR
jgi:hypothetical protein